MMTFSTQALQGACIPLLILCVGNILADYPSISCNNPEKLNINDRSSTVCPVILGSTFNIMCTCKSNNTALFLDGVSILSHQTPSIPMNGGSSSPVHTFTHTGIATLEMDKKVLICNCDNRSSQATIVVFLRPNQTSNTAISHNGTSGHNSSSADFQHQECPHHKTNTRNIIVAFIVTIVSLLCIVIALLVFIYIRFRSVVPADHPPPTADHTETGSNFPMLANSNSNATDK